MFMSITGEVYFLHLVFPGCELIVQIRITGLAWRWWCDCSPFPHLESCASALCHKQLQILVRLSRSVLQIICLTSASYELCFGILLSRELIQRDGLLRVSGHVCELRLRFPDLIKL